MFSKLKLPRFQSSKSTNGVDFGASWRNYYLGEDEKCPTCKPEFQPSMDEFHCLACHKNKKVARKKDIKHLLKEHYNRIWLIPKAGRPIHDENCPPRLYIANSFDKLDSNNKLTVAEGMHC